MTEAEATWRLTAIEALVADYGLDAAQAAIRAEGNDPVAVDEAIAADDRRARDLGIEFVGVPSLKQLLSEPPPTAPEEPGEEGQRADKDGNEAPPGDGGKKTSK